MELYRELYKTNPEFLLAEQVCQVLGQQGYQAYLAGGCVRDFFLQREPHDFDVATNALPEQVEKLFPKTLAVGKDFGVIVVVGESPSLSSAVTVEVATFRKDGQYEDGRHPTSVEFSEAEEDARRRDLTVNALFFDLQKNQVIDYVQGLQDLQGRRLRAVGDPEKRFQEDHLRILRTLRFSAQLGFEIEPLTAQACRKLAPLINQVSGERLQEEISKLLLGEDLEKGLHGLFDSQVLGELLGRQKIEWRPWTPYFEVGRGTESADSEQLKEQRWFEFFLWISQMLSPAQGLDFFEGLTLRWKFSKDLRRKTLNSLRWVLGETPLSQRPLGELLALSFEADQLRGLRCYGQFFLRADEKSLWESFLQRKAELGETLPAPWVSSSDLIGEVQGPQLGQALRFCYHRQLEGDLRSPAELISAWRKKYGNS